MEDLIVKDPVTASNHHPAVTLRIVSESNAWLELQKTWSRASQSIVVSGKRLRARIIESLENLHRAVVRLSRQNADVGVPAYAGVECQMACDRIVVLEVESQLVPRRLSGVSRAGAVNDLRYGAGRGKALRIPKVQVVLDRQWVVEKEYVVPVGVEEEKPA